jgi:hypothetical protein
MAGLVYTRVGEDRTSAYWKIAAAVGLEAGAAYDGEPVLVAGQSLKMRINAFLRELGPYPHAALIGRPLRWRHDRQESRQVRARCPQCRWTVLSSAARLRRGWLICGPCGARMEPDPRDVPRLLQAPRKPGRPRKRGSPSLAGRGSG